MNGVAGNCMTASEILKNRVVVVTGASRGIGRAFALKFAAQGACVVVAAKSEVSSEKLPGSIYTVAEEIEACGGTALPIKADVRSELDVKAMVERTAEKFGRIDILVNNAGALWWQPILKTPPKRYDLMWEVNVRASYLCIYYCLPHMIAGGWGHIINLSPPISVEASPGYVCYMTTKMGMTRLALGVAAEHFKDNIAANALWPATPIESQATINLGLGTREQWRSPDILCDAAMEILKSEPKHLTGRQLIDEDFLRERGWSQERLDSYWLSGKPPKTPIWIDGRNPSDYFK
jgi:citronellol/citronellal dehydrogenase